MKPIMDNSKKTSTTGESVSFATVKFKLIKKFALLTTNVSPTFEVEIVSLRDTNLLEQKKNNGKW